MKDEQARKDAEMKERMERHVAKGIIVFEPVDMGMFQKRAETLRIGDEWAKKLRERARRKT